MDLISPYTAWQEPSGLWVISKLHDHALPALDWRAILVDLAARGIILKGGARPGVYLGLLEILEVHPSVAVPSAVLEEAMLL